MNLPDIVAQIETQLQEIASKEEANQQEQILINRTIEELEAKIQQQYLRQSELDQEAIDLCTLGEQLREKQQKLGKIVNFVQDFQKLEQECQDNQDLLNTLYSCISDKTLSQGKDFVKENLTPNNSYSVINIDEDINNLQDYQEDFKLSIDKIKAKLPHAEKLYQKLVARYLEQYHTYQNLIVDGLDLIWCSVAFIAFGRNSYRQMSFKYHPDLDGSDNAMQLINTAWEISQEYLSSN